MRSSPSESNPVAWVVPPLVLLFLSGCASRQYGGTQTVAASSGGVLEHSKENRDLTPILLQLPRPKVTAVGGDAIHESENKQSVYLNKLLARILQDAASTPPNPLFTPATKHSRIPVMERPVDGFSSAIGNEDYLSRAAPIFAAKDVRPAAQAELGTDGGLWAELQQRWIDLAQSASKGELRDVAAMLLEYLNPAATVSPVPASLPFSTIFQNNLLDELGYWARPEGSPAQGNVDKVTELRRMSVGERTLARNRALLLNELATKRAKTTDSSVSRLRASLDLLAAADGQERLLWSRTHVLLKPAEASALRLMLGKLSVLAYSFAQIREVSESNFRLRIVSYQFAYAAPSWDGVMTREIYVRLCRERPHRTHPARKECDALEASSSRLGNPPLSQLAARGMARPLELRGYSPILITDETVALESLQGVALGLQSHLIERFSE